MPEQTPPTQPAAGDAAAPAAPPGRDKLGRFGKGNPGGPGNPLMAAATNRRMMLDAVLEEVVTREKLKAVVERVLMLAELGDKDARRDLLARWAGRVPHNVTGELKLTHEIGPSQEAIDAVHEVLERAEEAEAAGEEGPSEEGPSEDAGG